MDDTDARVPDFERRIREARSLMPEAEDNEFDRLGLAPWPRAQMNAMFRLIAGEMEMPPRCPEPRCRRAGHCRGGLGRQDCTACLALWNPADLGQLDAACLALAFGWFSEAERRFAKADLMLGDGEGRGFEPAGEAARR